MKLAWNVRFTADVKWKGGREGETEWECEEDGESEKRRAGDGERVLRWRDGSHLRQTGLRHEKEQRRRGLRQIGVNRDEEYGILSREAVRPFQLGKRLTFSFT